MTCFNAYTGICRATLKCKFKKIYIFILKNIPFVDRCIGELEKCPRPN